ncbi:MAG: hypothetical protein ACK4N5_06305, partial [Myxococcales bacterium]
GAQVEVRGGEFVNNAVALHVQGGSSLHEQAGTPAPRQVFVSPETRFVGNGSRVGAGELPLPPAFGLEAPR